MYKDLIKAQALHLVESGASQREVAALLGVSRKTVSRWCVAKRSLSGMDAKPVSYGHREKASYMNDELYAPPKSGPLAGLQPSEIENLLLRAVLADLKAEGWALDSISNKSKCELGERLRLATALPLRSIIGFLKISKSSYEYHRSRIGKDRYASLRKEIKSLFAQSNQTFGYRRIWAHLRRGGRIVSEKVVRRIMKEEGLVVIAAKRTKKYNSYKGELNDAPKDLVKRKFRAYAPDRLWLTDMTEFALPKGKKIYLNPIIDCFDGAPIAWAIGTRPTKELTQSCLEKAVSRLSDGSRPIIHSDRGVHYRTPSWIATCEREGITRSMSRKGCCADNSACEGFFGRLKIEFYYGRDWRGVSAQEFMDRLDAYMRYYRDERIKKSLGWLSPKEYRERFGYAI